MKRYMILILIVTLSFVFACKRKESSQVTRETAIAQKISKIEQDISKKEEDMHQLLIEYQKAGGKDLGNLMGNNLNPEQKALLEKRLKDEKGIGYSDLISEILGNQKSMEDLQVQVQELEKRLPAPHVVEKGETHESIALHYLMDEKGVSEADAKELVSKVNLLDTLIPGFKVWNFFDSGIYGTFVTQGDAPISPNYLIKREKEKLISAKEKAISERDVLAEEKSTLIVQIKDLETKRDDLLRDIDGLKTERDTLIKKTEELTSISEEQRSQLNSVYYRVGVRKELVGKGIIKDSFFGRPKPLGLKIEDLPGRLDLRESDVILISASDVKVNKIKKVTLLPATHKSGIDYLVEITKDGMSAKITIKDKAKFQMERVVIAIN